MIEAICIFCLGVCSGIRVHALYYMDWDDVLVGLLTGEVVIIDE